MSLANGRSNVFMQTNSFNSMFNMTRGFMGSIRSLLTTLAVGKESCPHLL
jgi:hypothetical protein